MKMRKRIRNHKKIALFCIFLLLIITTIFVTEIVSLKSGKQLISPIQHESIGSIIVQKEINEKIVSTEYMSDEQKDIFYHEFQLSRFKKIGSEAFPVSSNYRIIIQVLNEQGTQTCRMEFYGMELLIFDCGLTSNEYQHGRYKILQTGLGKIFE